jgi:MHS family proline/betaine transporter-like MFS transporter
MGVHLNILYMNGCFMWFDKNMYSHYFSFAGYGVMAAANFGTLLGGVIGFTMREVLEPEQLLSWGWRVPFLSGILVSFSGVYLRFFCPEDDPHLFHAGPDAWTAESTQGCLFPRKIEDH